MTVVERSIEFSAPAERVWAVIGDVPAAAACLPGLSLGAALDERSFAARISVSVGLLSLLYAGRLTVEEIDHERRRVAFGFEGVALGGLTLAVRIEAQVSADGESASRLAIVNDIGLDVATTMLAGPMIAPTGALLLDGFARNIRQLVERAAAPPAP
jgi:carbon monoxide dehydrogenase subunit G